MEAHADIYLQKHYPMLVSLNFYFQLSNLPSFYFNLCKIKYILEINATDLCFAGFFFLSF